LTSTTASHHSKPWSFPQFTADETCNILLNELFSNNNSIRSLVTSEHDYGCIAVFTPYLEDATAAWRGSLRLRFVDNFLISSDCVFFFIYDLDLTSERAVPMNWYWKWKKRDASSQQCASSDRAATVVRFSVHSAIHQLRMRSTALLVTSYFCRKMQQQQHSQNSSLGHVQKIAQPKQLLQVYAPSTAH